MIEKAVLTSDKNTIQISVPFAKIDRENRIVSGFATLDNVDKSNDVVTSEASEKAFNSFRGNVREQHLPIAAGKVVNFRQQEFFDPETQKMYNGVFVDAYVSKGAPDTWEKVIDGTLSGFSIGGNINKASSQFIPEADKTVRFITDYDLVELSLVDSPANHLCNVFSISKADGLTKADGIATTTTVENVFWCSADQVAIATSDESAQCSSCKSPMENAGWFESVDETEKAHKIREVLEASKKIQKKQEPKGGSEMAEEKETVVEAVEKAADKEVVTETTEALAEAGKVAKAEEASEVTEPDFENLNKALTEIKELVKQYNQKDENRDGILKSVSETVSTFEKTVEDKFTELLTKHNDLSKDFNDFKTGLEKVEKRLDGVESGSAMKKSNDVVEEKTITKSNDNNNPVWQGAFLPDITSL